MLEDVGTAALDAVDAFVEPADGGAERGAVGANFSLLNKLVHELPEGVVLDLRHADIVELEDVDVVGGEALEGFVHGFADEGHGEVLRDFALAAAFVAVLVEVVADLGGDDDLVALVGEGPGDEFLAVAVAVGVGGIEEGDAEIERLVHERDGFAFGEGAPPAGGDGPETEADFGDADFRFGQGAKFHAGSLDRARRAGKEEGIFRQEEHEGR